MNLNKFLFKCNTQIDALNDALRFETVDSKKFYAEGVIEGISYAVKTLNEVNMAAVEDVKDQTLRTCNGYSSRKGLCKGKVNKYFLRLYCDECHELRSQERKPLYADNKLADHVLKFGNGLG
jgi:hypothetical protein